MRFDLEEIEALLRLFERSSLTEMVVEWGEMRLTFKRQPQPELARAQPVLEGKGEGEGEGEVESESESEREREREREGEGEALAEEPAAAVADLPDSRSQFKLTQPGEAADTVAAEAEDLLVVCSPVVGIFRRRPGPDQEPFVEVGDRVREGDILAVVEAMKVLTEVRAAEEGIVEEILVEDGQPVEYGQELMVIRKCEGG